LKPESIIPQTIHGSSFKPPVKIRATISCSRNPGRKWCCNKPVMAPQKALALMTYNAFCGLGHSRIQIIKPYAQIIHAAFWMYKPAGKLLRVFP
jgi:hypothetical protein